MFNQQYPLLLIITPMTEEDKIVTAKDVAAKTGRSVDWAKKKVAATRALCDKKPRESITWGQFKAKQNLNH